MIKSSKIFHKLKKKSSYFRMEIFSFQNYGNTRIQQKICNERISFQNDEKLPPSICINVLYRIVDERKIIGNCLICLQVFVPRSETSKLVAFSALFQRQPKLQYGYQSYLLLLGIPENSNPIDAKKTMQRADERNLEVKQLSIIVIINAALSLKLLKKFTNIKKIYIVLIEMEFCLLLLCFFLFTPKTDPFNNFVKMNFESVRM